MTTKQLNWLLILFLVGVALALVGPVLIQEAMR
jgi:preprotein translocase subunit SecG